MNILETLLLVAHVAVAAGICAFVLLQHGKGADMGAAFGSGSSGSLFGAAGSANFLSRTTAILAAVFFATSLGLTWYTASHSSARAPAEQGGVMDRLPASKAGDVPAAPTGAGSAPAPASNVPAADGKGAAADNVKGGAAPAKAAAPGEPASKAADVPK